MMGRGAIGVLCVAVAGLTLGAQAPPAPPSASAARAREVADLMTAKKLDAFAARDSSRPGRFVAAMLVPNVQLLTISAGYSKANDIEYSLYHKLFENAYLDLNAGALSIDKFFVDDQEANGLIAVPGKKSLQHDTVAVDSVKHVFDGDFVDPKKKNSKKVPEDVYMKTFADADARYAQVLDALLVELKKAPAVLAGAGLMR